METFIYWKWEWKLVQSLRKRVWRVLKNLKIELPYDPAIPHLSTKQTNKQTKPKTLNLKRYIYPSVHNSIIYNCQASVCCSVVSNSLLPCRGLTGENYYVWNRYATRIRAAQNIANSYKWKITFKNHESLFYTQNLGILYTSVCVSHSVMSNTLWSHGLAHQALLFLEFSRQEYWSGLLFTSIPQF